MIQNADHSFKVPKRLGLSEGEILDRLAADHRCDDQEVVTGGAS